MTHLRRIKYFTPACSDQPSDGIAGRRNFRLIRLELVGSGGGAGEGAVCFFVEAVGDGFDGVGEDAVVIGDSEGEAGFDGGELGEHKK